MSLNERHEDILRILERRERLSVAELTERLSVSEVTIRKDLAQLEEQGHLVRTRGGAALAQDRRRIEPIDRRLSALPQEKAAIGRAAAELVREGETLFIDSGSTCLALAHAIVGMDVRVVTNSLDVIEALAVAPGIAVHCTGGTLRRDARSFIGPQAVAALRQFHLDKAFLGASGITTDGAFSTQNAIEGEVKRAAIEQAGRSIILADGSKVGRPAFSIFARASDVQLVIMNNVAQAAELGAGGNIEVIIAGAGPRLPVKAPEEKKEKV